MQTLRLHQSFFAKIKAGHKSGTARQGRRPVVIGPLLLTATEDPAQTLTVTVTAIRHTTFEKLDDNDAELCGHVDLPTFTRSLQGIYPGILPGDEITFIEFNH